MLSVREAALVAALLRVLPLGSFAELLAIDCLEALFIVLLNLNRLEDL